jgi:hypothetical protein
VLAAGGELVVAVGLWVDNSLLLMHWPSTSTQQQQQQQQQQQLSPGCVMQLQEEQARSIAVLPVGLADVLLVGTNSGSVLMWQVEQQQQAGSCQLRHGRVVRISSTSVSLLPMQLPAATDEAAVPASSSAASSPSSTVASVYAHAGAGAVIRPVPGLLAARQRQQQAHQGSSSSSSSSSTQARTLLPATDCLLVSRVCGSEACLAAAPVAAADMPPHSLAWVSPSSKLCFGELDAVHKLRWRARGLPGTPLALALHKPSNTVLVLLQADAGSSRQLGMQGAGRQQQQLVLLDARSLAVLLVLGLAEGHTYTCLAVLDLPCTSQQQQQLGCAAAPSAADSASGHTTGASSSRSSRLGLRPFIVLGSCLNMALSQAGVNTSAAAGPSSADASAAAAVVPEELQVGMLSFFELQASMSAPGQAAAAGPGGSAQQQMRYDLLLHGMTPLPVTPACVCTVVPELLNEQAGGNPSTAAAGKAGSSERSAAQQQATEGTEAASKAAAEVAGQGPVCLAVGSEAGVSLLHVLVDDAGRQQQMMVQQQLAAAAEVSSGGKRQGLVRRGAVGLACIREA